MKRTLRVVTVVGILVLLIGFASWQTIISPGGGGGGSGTVSPNNGSAGAVANYAAAAGSTTVGPDSLLNENGTTLAYTGTNTQWPAGGCAAIAEKYGSTGTVGFAQGATTGQVGLTNGTLCSILFAVSNTPTMRMALAGNIGFSNTTGDASASLDTNISRVASGVLGVGRGAQGSATGLLSAGNHVFVSSDFTVAANTSLQTITGLSWNIFPVSSAQTFSIHCGLLYSQATAAVSDAFGIQGATTAPTNINIMGAAYTSASAVAEGTLTGLASTTATNIVTFTPSATATVFGATLDGTLELPSNATPTVVNIMVSTSNSADLITVKRGSYCTLF